MRRKLGISRKAHVEQLNELKILWILNVTIYDLAYERGISYLGKYGIAQTFADIETTKHYLD